MRVFPLLRERKTLVAKCFEEFCFFFLSPSSLLKNLGFVQILSFLNFSFSFCLIFHTRISQIAFRLFLLALKVCLQNLFCCAVVGRGEREEKDFGEERSSRRFLRSFLF